MHQRIIPVADGRRLYPVGTLIILALGLAGCATPGPRSEPGVGQVFEARPAPVAAPMVASAPAAPVILMPPVTTPRPPVTLPDPLPTPTPAPVRPPLALDVNGPRSLEQAAPKPAVLALYRQARAAQQAGQLDQASASLERALRLDARNGWLYQALAQVNLAARRPDVAQGQAQKALSLARRNPFLELSSLRTLIDALNHLGQAAQAAAASARANLLETRIRESGGRV